MRITTLFSVINVQSLTQTVYHTLWHDRSCLDIFYPSKIVKVLTVYIIYYIRLKVMARWWIMRVIPWKTCWQRFNFEWHIQFFHLKSIINFMLSLWIHYNLKRCNVSTNNYSYDKGLDFLWLQDFLWWGPNMIAMIVIMGT